MVLETIDDPKVSLGSLSLDKVEPTKPPFDLKDFITDAERENFIRRLGGISMRGWRDQEREAFGNRMILNKYLFGATVYELRRLNPAWSRVVQNDLGRQRQTMFDSVPTSADIDIHLIELAGARILSRTFFDSEAKYEDDQQLKNAIKRSIYQLVVAPRADYSDPLMSILALGEVDPFLLKEIINPEDPLEQNALVMFERDLKTVLDATRNPQHAADASNFLSAAALFRLCFPEKDASLKLEQIPWDKIIDEMKKSSIVHYRALLAAKIVMAQRIVLDDWEGFKFEGVGKSATLDEKTHPQPEERSF